MIVLLWLFVTFPQPTLPEPNDCIFVIRSMVDFAGAPSCRGWGSAIIHEVRRVYGFFKAQEKSGWFACLFGSLMHFPLVGPEAQPLTSLTPASYRQGDLFRYYITCATIIRQQAMITLNFACFPSWNSYTVPVLPIPQSVSEPKKLVKQVSVWTPSDLFLVREGCFEDALNVPEGIPKCTAQRNI